MYSLAPILLKKMIVDPQDPFKLEFIVDKGNVGRSDVGRKTSDETGTSEPITSNVSRLSSDEFKSPSTRLIKYFLAALTMPETDLWVNLSPVEKDRIMPKNYWLSADQQPARTSYRISIASVDLDFLAPLV